MRLYRLFLLPCHVFVFSTSAKDSYLLCFVSIVINVIYTAFIVAKVIRALIVRALVQVLLNRFSYFGILEQKYVNVYI